MQFLQFLGRFHILLLHLPIGMLAAWIGAELWTQFVGTTGRENTDETRGVERRSALADEVCRLLGWGTVLSSILAASCGLLLAMDAKYFDSDGFLLGAVDEHRLWGLFFCAMSCTALIARSLLPARGIAAKTLGDSTELKTRTAGSWIFWSALGLSAISMIPTGHLGGNLVHGPEFLVEKAPSWLGGEREEIRSDGKTQAQAGVNQAVVETILRRRCLECHRAEKASGDYRVDEAGLFRKTGKSGREPVSPHQGGELLRRLLLPVDDEEHMPPPEKEALEKEELLAIQSWIFAGAQLNVVGHDADLDHELNPELEFLIASLGGLIYPRSRDDARWILDFSRTPVPQRALIQIPLLLEELQDGIFELNLAGLPLHDEDIDRFPILPRLEYLNLSGIGRNQEASSAAIEWAAGLPELRKINLYGVFNDQPVTDEVIESLIRAPVLREVVLGTTVLSDEQLQKFAEAEITVVSQVERGTKKLDAQAVRIHFVSSEELGNTNSAPARNLFDGSTKTRWSSRWVRDPAEYPHTLIVDLQALADSGQKLTKIRLLARQDGESLGTPGRFEVGASFVKSNKAPKADDDSAWTSLLESKLWSSEDDLMANWREYVLPSNTPSGQSPSPRYLRLTFLEEISGDSPCSLSEIELWVTQLGP